MFSFAGLAFAAIVDVCVCVDGLPKRGVSVAHTLLWNYRLIELIVCESEKLPVQTNHKGASVRHLGGLPISIRSLDTLVKTRVSSRIHWLSISCMYALQQFYSFESNLTFKNKTG